MSLCFTVFQGQESFLEDWDTGESFSPSHPLPHIYLDYQATTPCDPAVIEAMKPFLETYYGNPHSRNHSHGWNAEDATQWARHQVAQLIGAQDKDVIFTSGATEANNLAIKGVAYFERQTYANDKKYRQMEKASSEKLPLPFRHHMITLVTEHKCVIETVRALESEGFSATFLPVSSSGIVDLALLENAIRPETLLVSISAVNNEIGVIQPLKAIGELCQRKGVYFHTDAAQALGKIPLDVEDMHIHLMSLSSHKVYGPKGIGALYVRRRPRVRLRPLFHGGGQERGLRSGTLPPFLCIGFGKACQLARESMEQESRKLLEYQRYFYDEIQKRLDKVSLNGDLVQRVPGNLNLSFFGIEGESLMSRSKEIALSSGSACTSKSLESSYVLRALGVGDDMAHSSIRLSFGRFTTWDDVKKTLDSLVKSVKDLREMSPLWEMDQEGVDIHSVQWVHH